MIVVSYIQVVPLSTREFVLSVNFFFFVEILKFFLIRLHTLTMTFPYLLLVLALLAHAVVIFKILGDK